MALERKVVDRRSCMSPGPMRRGLRVALGTDVQRIAYHPACSRPANAWRRGQARDGQGALSSRRGPFTLAPKTPPGRLLHAGGECAAVWMLWRRDLTPGGQGQVNCRQGLPWVAPQNLDESNVLIGPRQIDFIRGLRSLQDLQRTLTQFLSLAELSEFFCGIRGM